MKLPLLLVPFLLSPVFALAVEKPAPKHQLSEFKLGRTITGPAVDLNQLKGKAVFIDAWGTHCGPCLALMPEVEKLSRRYKDKLVVVGAEVQNSPDEEVKAIVKENRVTYGITQGVSSPVNFEGIPFGFVFDATGALLYAGFPNEREFDKAIRKAVQSVSTTAPSGLDALKRK